MPGFSAVTGEIDLTATIAGSQHTPAITRLLDGGYVIVWTQGEGDLFAQRFDALGNRMSGEITIAAGSNVYEDGPSVIGLASGGFAVVWTSQAFGADTDVRMRLFNADGTPGGDSFTVHAASSTNQTQAAVTQLVGGGLIVTWSSYSADQSDIEVWGRRLDPSGSPVGNEFLLSGNTVGVQSSTVITALPGGGLVATWQSVLRAGIDPGGDNTYDVYARMFDSAGQPVGGQFLVNTYTLSHQMRPAIATLSDGSFVIAWESHSQATETDFGLWAQRFDSAGGRIGSEFRIPNITAGDQGEVEIASLNSGGFVVSWMSYGTDGSGGGVYARQFDAAGLAVGNQFPVNFSTSGDQFSPDVAALPNGRLVVTWQSPDSGSATDVLARTFGGRDVQNDFNGDGRSDILWRHDDGRITDWLGTASGGFAPNAINSLHGVSIDWQIASTGDFNGDGRDDILWRNVDGRITDWLGTASGGLADNAANAYNSVATDWHVIGSGDFNGDGRDDILWRNTDGRITNWLGTSSGGFADNVVNAYHGVPVDWRIAGIGDFNGDGRDDILWRNIDGRITDWLGTANGGFADNVANAYSHGGTYWQVEAVGDFNGDGADDILWTSLEGYVTEWLGSSNGSFSDNRANVLLNVSTDWQVTQVGDFNGDGRDDILWRNDDGRISNWLGTASGGFSDNVANAYNSVATDWHVQHDVFL